MFWQSLLKQYVLQPGTHLDFYLRIRFIYQVLDLAVDNAEEDEEDSESEEEDGDDEGKVYVQMQTNITMFCPRATVH